MHRCHTLSGDVGHCGIERAILELDGGFRHHGIDEISRVVLQHARRFAGCIAHDGTTGNLTRSPRDFRRSERCGIRERHVSVESIDPDRVVRRNRIDPVASRELPAPQLMVPVAAGDPGAGRHCAGEVLDPSDELGWSLRVAQQNRREAKAAFDEMHVGVNEPRHHHLTAGVDDPRVAGGLLDGSARADHGNAVGPDADRFRPRTRAIAGPHARVHDDERQGSGLRRRFASGLMLAHLTPNSERHERDERTGSPNRTHGSPSLEGVAYVEEDFEVELLAAVGEIERCHLGGVTGGLGALERLAVHLIEVGEDAISGA